MTTRTLRSALLACAVACAQNPGPGHDPIQPRLVPVAEHHAHLLSPATAPLAQEPVLTTVKIPEELSTVLHTLERGWNDSSVIADLLVKDAMLFNSGNSDLPTWVLGRDAGARYLSERFTQPYRIAPVSYQQDGQSAQVAAYLTRGEGAATRYFGHMLLSLRKNQSGAWNIAVAAPVFPGPPVNDPITAANLIAQLDDAGIRRATVLSVAYWYGSPFGPRVENEYAKVRAENDWVAQQVGQYPDRLAAFCSFNPLKPYALEELERCAKIPAFRGIKLHFGNSGVELSHPEDAEKVGRVFRAANQHRLAIVVHMFTGAEYETQGGVDARVLLTKLLPEAPDVPIQIAHMAGGGRSTDSALAVFANAITAGDPRTRNLYFDVATLTAGETREGLQRDAMRMRQIGLNRILFGSDMSPPNPPPRVSWEMFRIRMPLTDAETRTIAANMAPYFR